MALAAKVWRWSAQEPEGSFFGMPWFLEEPEKAAELFVAATPSKPSCRVNVRDTDGLVHTFDVEPGKVSRVTGPSVPGT